MKTLLIGIVFTCAAIPARAQSPDPEEREAYRRGYEEGFARGYRKGLEVASSTSLIRWKWVPSQ
jgi:flagellar biosynthesis/type III secretory pathway protein FliH